MKLVSWTKQNKLTTVLLVIVLYFVWTFFSGISNTSIGVNTRNMSLDSTSSNSFGATSGVAGPSRSSILPPIAPEYAPTDSKDRFVIQDSYLSLLVKDVTDTRSKIVKYASDNGGYMVTSNVNNPQDAPTSEITVRIPTDKLEDALSFYRSLSVKVVSENLMGRDVTDQYVDIEKRIAQYERTLSRYEDLLDRATAISDITNPTQQIISTQSQIDSLKGQQESLKQNAELTKITMYLATDEIALPYAPSETFRPGVIFKLAVRSLITTLRDLAEKLIWIAVYSVIWIPILVGYILVSRWWKRRNSEISVKKMG